MSKLTTKTSKYDPALIRSLVRDIPDFPKKGIIFKDITPILQSAESLRMICDELTSKFKGEKIDQVVGIESRGFIFSPVIAYQLQAGFVPVRKKGKLPAPCETMSYDLEYGTDHLQIHKDAIHKGQRVIIVDDLLATGGTAEAVVKLVQKLGGVVVGLAFVIELEFLKGRSKLSDFPLYSLISYS